MPFVNNFPRRPGRTTAVNRAVRRQVDRENRKWPLALEPVPPEKWKPLQQTDSGRFAVWRSRHFLVQAFREAGGVIRLSVNRTRVRPDGRWDDEISWDELQRLKAEAGYGDAFAVEIYPGQRNVVNMANMRHLWILPAPLEIGWRGRGCRA